MGTRAVIARVEGDGWAGNYHHWDGYPSGLGSTLFEIWRTVFNKDTKLMLTTLIDEHPAGWSTINGRDWSKEPGFVEHGNGPCTVCGLPMNSHYRPGIGGLPLGHHHQPEEDNRPQCYCHGDRHEEPTDRITSWGEDNAGTEYCYAISEQQPLMTIFWYHWSKRVWRMIGSVRLDQDEPNWDTLDGMPEQVMDTSEEEG